MFLIVIVGHGESGKGGCAEAFTDYVWCETNFGSHPTNAQRWLEYAGRKTGTVKAAIDEILVFEPEVSHTHYAHFKRNSAEQF